MATLKHPCLDKIADFFGLWADAVPVEVPAPVVAPVILPPEPTNQTATGDIQTASSTNWLEQNWHPLCGAVYLSICLLDFCLLPIYYEYTNYNLSAVNTVQLALQFKDSAAQIAALTALHAQHAWTPITLQQNGLFHLAFGAILGVGIWSKGRVAGADALNNLTAQVQTMATQVGTAGTNPQITPPTAQQTQGKK
jgi:hypothetical protein